MTEDELRKEANYLARLVQGSQALEGAALDAEGFQQLVDKAYQILKEKEMSKAKKEMVEKIYDTLFKQRFADFYNGEWADHIEGSSGDDKAADEAKMKERIAQLFDLN